MSELGMDITLMAAGIAGLGITTIAILRDLSAVRSRVPTVPAESAAAVS